MEDVSVDRRVVERNVRVGVHTTSRDHLIDEALTHELVEVERIAINRPVDAVPPIREEDGTTVISVVEEVVFIEKRLVLKEEVHIRRVRVPEMHREVITLRQQDIVVERIKARRNAPQFAGGTGADTKTTSP